MVRNCLLLLAGFTVLTPARAGMITVTGTLAEAAAIHCYQDGTTFAMCSESPPYGSATSVTDIDAGHLGAFLGASAPGYVNGFAQGLVGLSLSDFTDTDFLEIDFSLHGTFSNGGATASVYVDTGDSFTTYQISCGPYYEQNYGRSCSSDGTQQAIIPLANVDTLGLTFLLQPALTYAPAFADFLNSMDLTIQVPDGTTIVNNPGGTLFASQVTSVPEPSAALLTVLGLIAMSPSGRILRGRGCKESWALRNGPKN
jgi:hypothetical protein